MLLMLFACQAMAASRVLDRIETRVEGDNNVIAVHFNIPVRYVSHVMNDANSEIGIQLQIVPTPEVDLEDLLSRDQLSWKPTEEIPLSKVVYQGTGVGTSSLLVSFATPVKDFRIRQSRDFYVMEFVLKKAAKLPQVEKVPMIDIDVPETRPPLRVKSLPLVIYVINLTSESKPLDLDKIAPVPVDANEALYTTRTLVDGSEWHRLRLGFFRTQNEAKAKLKAVKNFYPKAWIDRADLSERRQALFESGLLPAAEMAEAPAGSGDNVVTGVVGVGAAAAAGTATTGAAAAEGAGELATGAVEAEPEPQPQAEEQPPLPADERLTKMIELIRHAMTAGEYDKAIRMLEGFLEEPENYYTKEAMELLGLARERNGQRAHAKAEYEAFLEKYPEGEDAERVKQRLLGLITAPKTPKERLREEEEEQAVEWETYGSVSQHYRRDSIDNPGDENDIVSRSEIETFVDINSRRRSQSLDVRMKLTGSYVSDLLSDGPGNDKTLSDAYVDVEHLASRTNFRMGRQRLRSSGILNRFDGLVLGYELTPDINIRGYAGLPVESSRDVFLNEHKEFVGVSGDIANLFENWDLSLFAINQDVDGLVDRQAVGGEFRYFDQEKSLFGLVDYDTHYGALDIFALQGNWTLSDKTRVYMNLDYRKSPLLQTSNAIRNYFDPVQYDLSIFDPVDSIEELLKFQNEDYIYSRAEDLTGDTTTLTFGASQQLSSTLQITGDVTITNTKGTPQQGDDAELDPTTPDPTDTRNSNDFIAAVEDTGNEYYYNFQLIKNDLLKPGDIGIFNLRYYDTSTSNTLRLGVSSRYPITNVWRVNPRIDVSYRKRTDNDDTRLMVSPYLRMDYRLRRSFTLEFEGGFDWYKEENDLETTKFTDYFFIAGYRWDF
ncbi:MAG: tetratricopeptide repeat protein [Candidatus Thiodiazotropha sp.]